MQNILSSLLSQDLAKKESFEKVLWFVHLMKWLQRPRTSEEKDTKMETVYTVRLKYILKMLDNNPEWKSNFIESVTTLLFEMSSTSQFSKMGFSSQGFVQELIYRLQEKILPRPPLTKDLETLIAEVFPEEVESIYVDFIDHAVLTELFSLFAQNTELEKRLKTDILSATYVLSVQMLTTLFTIRQNLNFIDHNLQEFPEFQLAGLLRQDQIKSEITIGSEVFDLLKKIEINIEEIYRAMHTQGVKIELVYLFQSQKRRLIRLKLLLGFLNPDNDKVENFRLFVSQLILDSFHQKSFKSFIRENLSLLTERIVQANSHVGEHYVTFTRDEFKRMFRSAAGGGAVTALTLFIKTGLGKLGLVGFIKGIAESLNYSSSFLLIQILGFTLATKQPSNTAPFIAAEILKSTEEAKASIVALVRTQIIAVIGNLSLVFPICFVGSFLFTYFGNPIIEETEAISMFTSTNILGPSILFASFTGFLLFAASLVAGWIENWIIVYQLVKRIRYNDRIRGILGEVRTKKFAEFVSNNANALAANISLGFFLGMTPQVMKFLGVGLDVRHVTLATGGFALSLPVVMELGFELWEMWNSILGILVIGFLNLTVSFLLAFLLASASSKVKFSTFMKLFRSGMRLILVRPWLLVLPDKDNKSS